MDMKPSSIVGTSVWLVSVDETEPAVYHGLFLADDSKIRFYAWYNNQPFPDEGYCQVCGIHDCCHKEKIAEFVDAGLRP